MTLYLLHFIYTAAVFGLRARQTGTAKGTLTDVGDLLSLYETLGCPPMPCTATWYQPTQSERLETTT